MAEPWERTEFAAATALPAVRLSQAPLTAGVDTGAITREHATAARVGCLTATELWPAC